MTVKNIAKKIGKYFGKQWFLAILAHFGTIWQPWSRQPASRNAWQRKRASPHVLTWRHNNQ